MQLCLIFCDSPHIPQEYLCPAWVITWAWARIRSKSPLIFNITLFLFTDSMPTIKQFKSQPAKQHLLGFNLLYFVKVHYAEQEKVVESIYLRAFKLTMDKGSGTQAAVPKSSLLLLMPKPQEPAYSVQSLGYATVCKSCCLQRCPGFLAWSGTHWPWLVASGREGFPIIFWCTSVLTPLPSCIAQHG